MWLMIECGDKDVYMSNMCHKCLWVFGEHWAMPQSFCRLMLSYDVLLVDQERFVWALSLGFGAALLFECVRRVTISVLLFY